MIKKLLKYALEKVKVNIKNHYRIFWISKITKIM
jgi:hypothetical protein